MEVTHVIRGDDHLTNAFRQTQIYKLMGWDMPEFAHIPLIHGADGAKMSKRHGALGVDSYRNAGFLPEAVCNYLLRLGWSHGDDEIISSQQAVEWFGLASIGRAAARFDLDKLTSLNGNYIRASEDKRLVDLVMPLIREKLDGKMAIETESRLLRGMPGLKDRAKTLLELSENAEIYAMLRPLPLDGKATEILDGEGRGHLQKLHEILSELDDWTDDSIQDQTKAYADSVDIKLGKAAQPLRAGLTGRTVSPSIFEVMEILGRDETLARLEDVLIGPK
ncbi:MAG: glutamate--tRNA ligase, partial [Rhodospirillales bacterium]|nr:glutamate--tRNA ligase [Rhodospirillales bacterium]